MTSQVQILLISKFMINNYFDSFFDSAFIRENMKMDLAKALLAAAREYYKKDSVKFIECVKCILYKDRSIIKQKIDGIPLLELAVREDLSCIFEVRDGHTL